MEGTQRRRLSTRTLMAIVALFALIGLALLAVLVATILLGPDLAFGSGQRIAATPVVMATVEPATLYAQSTLPRDSLPGQGWLQQPATPTPSPVLAKSIVSGGQIGPRWTATPVPTNTPIPTPTPNPTFVSSAYGLGSYMPEGIGRDERWIDVNLTEQKLVAFEGLIPVYETLVSTGTARYPTVTGQFRIWLRFRSQDMNGYRLGYDYYLRNVPYVQYFYEDYALHGTFWHSNFGQPMSHGCVNLATADAEWLYNWAGYGTLVNIHP